MAVTRNIESDYLSSIPHTYNNSGTNTRNQHAQEVNIDERI